MKYSSATKCLGLPCGKTHLCFKIYLESETLVKALPLILKKCRDLLPVVRLGFFFSPKSKCYDDQNGVGPSSNTGKSGPGVSHFEDRNFQQD